MFEDSDSSKDSDLSRDSDSYEDSGARSKDSDVSEDSDYYFAESVASDSSDWSYVGESKQDNSDSSESDNDGGGESEDSSGSSYPKITETYRICHTKRGRTLFNATIFAFDEDLQVLVYIAGLQPSLWGMLPRELVTWIAEALRDWLREHTNRRSWLKNLAMVCRSWRKLLSPLQWDRRLDVTQVSQLHDLEGIVSSPLSSKLKDHIHHLRLSPNWGNDNKGLHRFFSAWHSLSRYLRQVTRLHIAGEQALKSPLISLCPCPRSLRHVKTLDLHDVFFPSFPVLLRDIGALPSLEQLVLDGVRWDGACDPSSPPASTAIFGSIKSVSARNCTDRGWPFAWMFTASSIRYTSPWRVPDDATEERTRSVRIDVRASAQASRWMRSSMNSIRLNLRYIDYAPKGSSRFILVASQWDTNLALGITVTAPTSVGLGLVRAEGSLLQLTILCNSNSNVEAHKWEELSAVLSDVMHPLAVDILSPGYFAEDAQARIQARIPSATVHLHIAPYSPNNRLWHPRKVVKKFWEHMDGAGAAAGSAGFR